MSDSATLDHAPVETQERCLDVEFLFWEECPSHEQALKRLREVMQESGVSPDVRIVQVETDQLAEKLNFPGSPTIRINGADIEPDVDDAVMGLTCRAYRNTQGKISPLPSKELIARAIDAARNS
jgi:hypothetical protein